jgi:hypothetical protein
MIVSHSVLLILVNVSDRSCREYQNTHSVFSNCFFENCTIFLNNVKKYCRAGQATDDNIVHALCMLDNEGYRHTLRTKM